MHMNTMTFVPDTSATTEALAKLIRRLGDQPGIRALGDNLHAFDHSIVTTNKMAASCASVIILLNFANGGAYGALRDTVASVITGLKACDETLDARTRLAGETSKHALQLAAQLAHAWCDDGDWIDPDRGMHRWDAQLVEHLAALGAHGKGLATRLEVDSRSRGAALRSGAPTLAYEGFPPSPAALWKLWFHPGRKLGCVWIEALCKALWLDQVEPCLRREAERRARNHEALAMPIHSEVVRLHSRAGSPTADSRQLVFDDGTTISFDSPLLDGDALVIVARGIQLLGSVDAHRLLRWEVATGYRQWLEGKPNDHVIELDRGYGELADRLGIHDKAAPQRLRAVLMAQRSCAFPLPGPGEGTGNLVVLSEWLGSGRRPGRVRIELGQVLMPTYVHTLAEHFTGRELASMERLVPLVALPPFVGRARDHGAQATLSMLAVRELRLCAEELFREGGVNIGLHRWAALAAEARIPRSQVGQRLRPILERWTSDGDDGPAFLKFVDARRSAYTLGDAHEAARRFLQEAGRRTAVGAEAGRRSTQARGAKLQRLQRR